MDNTKQSHTDESLSRNLIGRRAFIGMAAAMTTGVVAAQSVEVKRLMRKNDPNPAREVKAVSDEEFDAAVTLLEETDDTRYCIRSSDVSCCSDAL